MLDALVGYMLEFDWLPNPMLTRDGTLTDLAPEAAHRGEALFKKPFEQMRHVASLVAETALILLQSTSAAPGLNPEGFNPT